MMGPDCIAALLITVLAAIALAQPVANPPSTSQPALPLIVAHRGLSADYPENTLAAFKAAWENGADAIEGDFHLTADGRVITIHDGDTKRVAGAPMLVAESKFDDLRKLDAGSWKGPQFAGERLPTLPDVLALTPPGKLVLLEIKCGPEIVPAFVKELRASKLKAEQLRMITFKEETLRAFKAAMPEVKSYFLYEFKQDESGKWSDTPENLIKRAKDMGADGLDLSIKPKTMAPITKEVVALMKAQGLEFHAWTIDDPAIARHAIEIGAQSLTTNRCGALRAELLSK